jgi:hypothetical protein
VSDNVSLGDVPDVRHAAPFALRARRNEMKPFRFPVGYFVMPALLAALVLIPMAIHSQSSGVTGTAEVADEAVVDEAVVVPSFAATAASRLPSTDREWSEILDALAWDKSPAFVDELIKFSVDRGKFRTKEDAAKGIPLGKVEEIFIRHFRDAAITRIDRDRFPIRGHLLDVVQSDIEEEMHRPVRQTALRADLDTILHWSWE